VIKEKGRLLWRGSPKSCLPGFTWTRFPRSRLGMGHPLLPHSVWSDEVHTTLPHDLIDTTQTQ
jgi:hypothetical protein